MSLTINQIKAVERFNMVQLALDVFRLFFELGYKTKRDVYLQLCIHYPEYSSKEYHNKFSVLWNFQKLDVELISALHSTIDKINAQ